MTRPTRTIADRARRVWGDRRGFSTIETMVIFLSFVALAAVFAFSVMNTGILTAGRSEETILSGLDRSVGLLIARGAVIGVANAENSTVDSIRFQATNANRGTDGVNLSPTVTVVTYMGADQVVRLEPDEWSVTWLTGFGSLVNPGERVEVSLDLTRLDPRLGSSKEFLVEVSSDQGAPLRVRRTTPAELADVFDIP